MRDFKSLIYKHSSVNQASLDALKPILLKRIPHQLEELKLIDVKISPSMITFLMDSLIEQSQVSKLALVSATHTAESFDKTMEFIATSEKLEDIDMSSSIVPKNSWVKLFETLHSNKTLRNLKIGYN